MRTINFPSFSPLKGNRTPSGAVSRPQGPSPKYDQICPVRPTRPSPRPIGLRFSRSPKSEQQEGTDALPVGLCKRGDAAYLQALVEGSPPTDFRTPITDIPSACFHRADPRFADQAAGTGGDSYPSMAGVNSGYPRLEVGARGSSVAAVAVDNLGELSPAVGGRTGLLVRT